MGVVVFAFVNGGISLLTSSGIWENALNDITLDASMQRKITVLVTVFGNTYPAIVVTLKTMECQPNLG
jgi:hypothetical protein